MKNIEAKKIREAHTNRLLISVTVSLLLLLILLLVHKGQGYSHTILQTQAAVLILAIASAVIGVVVAVIGAIKNKKHLFEYAAIAIVMALCFYCLHGVGFITIKLAKYITVTIVVAYLVISFIYHTVVSKIKK